MPCHICKEEYRGLAGDCACTMYGYTDEVEFRTEAHQSDIDAYDRHQLRKNRADPSRLSTWVWVLIIATLVCALVGVS